MNVLILGGVGFIGRNLVAHLLEHHESELGVVRVLDKVLPQTAFLNKAHVAAFEHDKVVYKQANLSSPASIEKNFAPPDGGKWDLVVNLAAETKYGQTEEVYKEKVLDVAKKCAAEAAKHDIGTWVEVSTGQVYDASKKASSETDKLKPWTKMA